jgi:pyruvate dehydrogenase E2 component (dihydrolipoamide acetyltransferase)
MSIKNIIVPELGSDADVAVIEMLVKVGDTISPDTIVATLESDKATMDVPAAHAGVVQELLVKPGDVVASGKVLLVVTSDEETEPLPASQAVTNPSPGAQHVAAALPTAPLEVPAAMTTVHAGPAVRRLAREFGVDLTLVNGSGFKQRILTTDVQAYVKAKLANNQANTQPALHVVAAPVIDFAKFGQITYQSLSRIKKLSGKNLHRNWLSIPHVTQFAEADITELLAYRQQYKDELAADGIKLTVLVFILRAVVKALQRFPTFNASLDPQGEQLILKHYYHIGVAVETPDGLVVPVIPDVNLKSIGDLAKELANLSHKARNKLLTANDLHGGCFSISSLGGIGGTAFTPIINAPEVAILGVSMVSKKPIYQEDGSLLPRMMLPLALSYDHRVIDGAEAARFIVYLSKLLADVRHLLI